MDFHFVDPLDGSSADPTNVLDAGVRKVRRTVPAPDVVYARAVGRGASLKAERVAEWTGHVKIDVRPGVPTRGHLHQTGAVATIVVDDPVAIVVERIARLFSGVVAIEWNRLNARTRYDRDENRRFDCLGDHFAALGLGDLFPDGALRAAAGAGDARAEAEDPNCSRHAGGTIAELGVQCPAMREHLEEAKAAVLRRADPPEVALVLGSGLGSYADTLEGSEAIPYVEIPHMPLSAVAGHAGNLVCGTRGGRRVAAMQGRFHLYEGHPADAVVFGVRLLACLGAKTLIITNAAGGLSEKLAAGDLMAIVDQLNLTGRNLIGVAEGSFAPPFIDMTEAYDRELIDLAKRVASDAEVSLREGVYAGLLGPAYETPAEVRMLRKMGADAVGMSTVLEVIAARQVGMRVLGISCITNAGAGMGKTLLSHEEVTETAKRARPTFEALLSGVLEQL